MEPRNFFELLLAETASYDSVLDFEKLVDHPGNLTNIPIQPLFSSLVQSTPNQVAMVLPKLSPEQRQLCLDLDVWNKDDLNPDRFNLWLEAYAKTPDDSVRSEFAQSKDFGLLLKAKFNIWTFDVEDPLYPEHDRYFLTDDNLLLFEFDEEFEFVKEVKSLVDHLYTELGVEDAYSLLFKYVVDSYYILQEESYGHKNDRLGEFGFVDYYQSLRLKENFLSKSEMKAYLKKYSKLTPEVDDQSLNQTPPSKGLIVYKEGMDDIHSEIIKVEDRIRRDFLQFNFLQLVNGSITLEDALRDGSLALKRVGEKTKAYLNLGLKFIKQHIGNDDKSIFDTFDFHDLYKVGYSLYTIPLRNIRQAFKKWNFDSSKEAFLGRTFNTLLDNSYLEIPMLEGEGKKNKISDLPQLEAWEEKLNFLSSILPFASKMYEVYENLAKEDKLHSSFYLNYSIEDIDFEAILMSSFIHHTLGTFGEESSGRLAVRVDELRSFVQKVDKSDSEFLLDTERALPHIDSFMKKYGFESLVAFPSYFCGLLKEQLEGYKFSELDDEEFKHVGGPILLAAEKS